MYLECARIYIGGAPAKSIRPFFPKARAIGGRVYVGYDNANGEVYKKAERAALAAGGFVESEAD